MNRPILVFAFALCATAALSAQQQTSSDPYEGVSHPPADDTITTAPPQPVAKPRAGTPMVAPAPAPAVPAPAPQAVPVLQPRPAASASSEGSDVSEQGDGTDDGIVQVAPSAADSAPGDPTLSTRRYANDPDGDIVHPEPLGPNTLPSGTMIRARLLTELSTDGSHRGQTWRARVASDVLQDNRVLIPAGSEIEGRVVEVSQGHPGGHGSIRLRPDTVTVADGSRYHLDAQVVGTPGAKTNVTGEGVINAGSRWKKDGIEYGGAVGAGAATGAIVAGPIGAATGSLVGAGIITVHLLSDHPQATLEQGTVLLFTLNSHLSLSPSTTPGS